MLRDLEIKREETALTGVAQWIEHQPANQRVISSIPSQGTCLGYWAGPQLEEYERQLTHVSLTHGFFTPSFSLPSLLFKSK